MQPVLRAPHRTTMNLLLVGNPNVGKTSLYNHVTGSRARVGNYPGVTVERRYASLKWPSADDLIDLTITDAPGTYSLVARSAEEQIVIDAILGWGGQSPPDAVIVVVNAAQLSRNLYFTLQLIELRVPLVIALNMVDDAGPDAVTPEQLEAALGLPCVATNGHTGTGTREVVSRAVEVARAQTVQLPRLVPRYRPEVLALLDRVAFALPDGLATSVERKRALSIWAMMSLSGGDELSHIPEQLRERVEEAERDYVPPPRPDSLNGEAVLDFDLEIIQARYQVIDQIVSTISRRPNEGTALGLADRVDRILLHPVSGGLAFLATMLFVFQSLFAWSDPAISLIESLVTWLQHTVTSVLPSSIITDLIVEGVLGGVGNVVVFLPQILLLFFFIGLLEDSGYMARVAYLMDRIMKTMGLHGRAFVPMLSGFACAVPAIMATRTLEQRRDRILTMMVVPLTTCSARLPVYTLLIGALFPVSNSGLPTQGLLLIGLYLFSVVMSLVAAWVLSKTVIPAGRMPLIMELPPYRLPRLRPTIQMMLARAASFLREAGTTILAATVFMWVLLSFPRTTPWQKPDLAVTQDTTSSSVSAPPTLEQSYAGRLGKAIEPVMRPLGFDWKITTGIIGAFAAREVFVSTLGLIFGMDELDDDATALRDKIRDERLPDGGRRYTPLMGLSLMVFFALACQCMSTLAVVRRETQSYRWPSFLFVYMTLLAYVCSLLIFQVGKALGY